MEVNKIIVGDCLIKLKELEDNSVDSINLTSIYGYVILDLWKNIFVQFVKKNLKSVFIKNATLHIVPKNVLIRVVV